MRRMLGYSLSVALTLCTAGCGSDAPKPAAPDAQQRIALNDVGELYRIYQLRTKKPPRSPKDLEASEMGGPNGMAAIRNSDVIVQWGATLPDLGEEPGAGSSKEVLAYEKKVPEQGGLVLMLDRTVKTMTPEEFKAAPKPAGSKTTAAQASK
jgi:hypothetical protein